MNLLPGSDVHLSATLAALALVGTLPPAARGREPYDFCQYIHLFV